MRTLLDSVYMVFFAGFFGGVGRAESNVVLSCSSSRVVHGNVSIDLKGNLFLCEDCSLS